jgi:GNAT superfamily N-acetyltransferase
LAKIFEIPDILDVTKARTNSMIEQGVYQWNEYYPSEEVFGRDIARKELYVLEIGDKIIGTIVVSTYMDLEYDPIGWLTPNVKNIYIHRLAVHPQEQKKGLCQRINGFFRKSCP